MVRRLHIVDPQTADAKTRNYVLYSIHLYIRYTSYTHLAAADFDPFLDARGLPSRRDAAEPGAADCRLLRCVMGSRLRSVWRKHIDSPATAADLVLLYRRHRVAILLYIRIPPSFRVRAACNVPPPSALSSVYPPSVPHRILPSRPRSKYIIYLYNTARARHPETL